MLVRYRLVFDIQSSLHFSEYQELQSEMEEIDLQNAELRKKADDERAKKEAVRLDGCFSHRLFIRFVQAVNKLQEIVTQKNPFASQITNSIRRQNRDHRNEHNLNRRLEQALQDVCKRERFVFLWMILGTSEIQEFTE